MKLRWKKVQDLEIGDLILILDQKWVQVQKVNLTKNSSEIQVFVADKGDRWKRNLSKHITRQWGDCLLVYGSKQIEEVPLRSVNAGDVLVAREGFAIVNNVICYQDLDRDDFYAIDLLPGWKEGSCGIDGYELTAVKRVNLFTETPGDLIRARDVKPKDVVVIPRGSGINPREYQVCLQKGEVVSIDTSAPGNHIEIYLDDGGFGVIRENEYVELLSRPKPPVVGHLSVEMWL